jgi:hypothetical protein
MEAIALSRAVILAGSSYSNQSLVINIVLNQRNKAILTGLLIEILIVNLTIKVMSSF